MCRNIIWLAIIFMICLATLLFGQELINGYRDWSLIPSPGNPAAGALRFFGNTATGRFGCLDSSGATCWPDGGIKVWTSPVGDPGAASPALASDNDAPYSISNDYGVDVTITAVACQANAGGATTVTPILTGGSGTSILTGALTCPVGSWGAGTVNGSPVIHSFAANGATCASTPCSIDVNITSADGVTKYFVLKVKGHI
jgi:hypothetical protein